MMICNMGKVSRLGDAQGSHRLHMLENSLRVKSKVRGSSDGKTALITREILLMDNSQASENTILQT